MVGAGSRTRGINEHVISARKGNGSMVLHEIEPTPIVERPVMLAPWPATAGDPLSSCSIGADILPTRGHAYARIRMRGVLDRHAIESLLQTCTCLMRRNVVRIIVDATELEGEGDTSLLGLVELDHSLEKRGGGVALLVSEKASASSLWTGLSTYPDERRALAALDADAAPPRHQAVTSARLVLPSGHEWPLSDGVLTIGRSIGNHLLLDDSRLAPEHAAIIHVGDEYVLIDRGSEGGTSVNGGYGRDLHLLRDGDRIEVGESILIFRSDSTTGRAGMMLLESPTDATDHPAAAACAWCADDRGRFRFAFLIAAQAQGRVPAWAGERTEGVDTGTPPHFVFADDSGGRWLRIRFLVSLMSGWLLALGVLWWYLVLQ